MAIARVTSSINGETSTSTFTSAAVTVSGLNTIAIVSIAAQRAISGTPTFGGQNLTLIDSNDTGAGLVISTYYLLNPPSGSQTATGNFTASAFFSITGVAIYSGVKQSGQPDSHGVNATTSATAINGSTTVVASDCWVVAAGGWKSTDTGTWSSGLTGLQQLNNINASSGGISDSNGTVATGSFSNTLSWTSTVGGGINLISIAPLPPVTASVLETFTVTESKTHLRGALSTVLETLSLTEAKTAVIAVVVRVLETIGLTETADALIKWQRLSKNSSSFSNESKHSSSWSNASKNSTSFNNLPKS